MTSCRHSCERKHSYNHDILPSFLRTQESTPSTKLNTDHNLPSKAYNSQLKIAHTDQLC